MLVEIDEVAVNSEDWKAVLTGDLDAAKRIRQAINGLSLYMHNLGAGLDGHTIVTLRELEKHDVFRGQIDTIKIELEPE